jgi:hypothetical protein
MITRYRRCFQRSILRLKSAWKQLVWFEHSSHMPNTEEKDKLNEFMINTVLPALPGECP